MLSLEEIKSLFLPVPDFPVKGIIFQDITPVFKHPKGLSSIVFHWQEHLKKLPHKVDVICGIESRGFILGAALSSSCGLPFIPLRKAGKLPRDSFKVSYELEYGNASLELHKDALLPEQRVLVIDDVLATGGTMLASLSLIRQAKAYGLPSCLVNLSFLQGQKALENEGYNPFSLIHF